MEDVADLGKIVCVELRYNKRESVCDSFSAPGSPLTGSFVISSTVLRTNSLQRIVVEMCNRLGWVPLVFMRVPSVGLKARSDRALLVLS